MSISAIRTFLGITLSILFIWLPSLFAGLAPNTKITTSTDLVCVQSLKVGDTICGYGPTNHVFSDVIIKNIEPVIVESIYVITTKHGTITASADQLFYEITSESFIPAEQLKAGNLFLTKAINALECISVEHKNIQTTVYDLTLEEPHLFFSSDAQILTHNAVPILLLGIPVAAPVIKFVASVGAIAGALYLEKVATSSLPIFAQCRKRRERKAARHALLASLNQNQAEEHPTPSNKSQPTPPPMIGNATPSEGQAPDPHDPKNKKDDEDEIKIRYKEEARARRRKCFENQNKSQLKKSYSSMKQRAMEHEEKLKKFLKDPDLYDNRNHLKRAPSQEERQSRIAERVRELQKQIRSFNLDMEIINQLIQLK